MKNRTVVKRGEKLVDALNVGVEERVRIPELVGRRKRNGGVVGSEAKQGGKSFAE